jgi:phosphatidate cytidylyltransferase
MSQPTMTDSAPAAPSSGGRNVPVATGVGVLLGVALVASLYLWKPVFVGLAALAAVVAVVELAGALAGARVRVPVPPLILGAVAVPAAAYAGGAEGLVAAFVLTAAVVVAWRAVEGAEGFVRDATAGIFVLAYAPLLVGFGTLMAAQSDGAEQVISVVLLVACSDTGGFFASSRFGRHKMSPHVSPKKSWEGFAGSVVLAGLVGALLVPVLLDVQWWQGLLLGLALVVTSTVGDLGESLIKRDLGIKDMSNILPGHGGLLDRIDSLLVSIPVAWMLFTVFLN